MNSIIHPAPLAIIMAGGTGGHIFPGIAVAKVLISQGWQVSWLGSKGGMEEKLVAEANIELSLIPVQGVRGKGLKGWLAMPWRLLKAVATARKMIEARQPQVVVGFGGFASGPGGVASKLLGLPLVIHEQNAVAGLTNQWLAKLAVKIFQAFPNAFPAKVEAETVGNPVRGSIVALNQRIKEANQPGETFNILVIGGSRGAQSFNQGLPAVFARLLEQHSISVRHQVGKGRLSETRLVYQNLASSENSEQVLQKVELVEFIQDIAEAYLWADLVICRAGASTVSEVACAGVAALFVPYPYAVDDHQTENALWLVNNNAALMCKEADLAKGELLKQLQALLTEPQQLALLQKNARSLAIVDAAERVAAFCNQLAANSHRVKTA